MMVVSLNIAMIRRTTFGQSKPPTPLVSRNETGVTALAFVLYPCVGILTRLAAARIIASLGFVPLTIDEALGFSDPERLQTMAAAIAVAVKDAEVILLTLR
jgi:hypothetical protein